ncbi:MAG TPA: hypothetical protein VK071_06355 [Tissierellales bacterium]|nr:hypothetical protein [Tissierellales bacterium]
MIKTIKKKFDMVEMLYYYWQVTSERGKVGEAYIIDVANRLEMKYIYDEEFNEEEARKVLSCISNSEPLNSKSRKARKFWNNNMWMLEDLEYTDMMITPVKTLNLDSLIDKINTRIENPKYEEVEVLFIPSTDEEYLIKENKLIINFFRVKPDLYEEGKVTIGELPFIDFIEEKLIELLGE